VGLVRVAVRSGDGELQPVRKLTLAVNAIGLIANVIYTVIMDSWCASPVRRDYLLSYLIVVVVIVTICLRSLLHTDGYGMYLYAAFLPAFLCSCVPHG
jgi:MFS-type transporter involved in bile tolerance (Atg22 family)